MTVSPKQTTPESINPLCPLDTLPNPSLPPKPPDNPIPRPQSPPSNTKHSGSLKPKSKALNTKTKTVRFKPNLQNKIGKKLDEDLLGKSAKFQRNDISYLIPDQQEAPPNIYGKKKHLFKTSILNIIRSQFFNPTYTYIQANISRTLRM